MRSRCDQPKTPGEPWAIDSGRYWDRTSDLFRVREARYRCANRPDRVGVLDLEVDTGFEPVYTALQAAASPLGQSTVSGFFTKEQDRGGALILIRADDEIRTRDPHLGKVMRYHCATSALLRISACRETLTDSRIDSQTEGRSPAVQPGRARNPTRRPGRVGASKGVLALPHEGRTTSRHATDCSMCNCVQCSLVSNPRGHPGEPRIPHGRLAQLVARFLHTEEVVGSSPASPTNAPTPLGAFFVSRMARRADRVRQRQP